MGVAGVADDSTFSWGINTTYWEISGLSGGTTLNVDCTDQDAVCTLAASPSMSYGTTSGGSSAATANVAAIAGLVRAYSPTLTAAQTRTRLHESASGIVPLVADAEWAIEAVDGLVAGIGGLDEVNDTNNHTWTGGAFGGVGGYGYVWERKEDGGSWHEVGTTQNYTLAVPANAQNFQLRLTVTSAGRRARYIKDVQVCMPEVCDW